MERRRSIQTSPLTNSMKNLRSGFQHKSPLSSSRALSTTSLGTLCYGNRLDLKTYTDARSNGFATRVAKYGGPLDSQQNRKPAYVPKSPFALRWKKPELKNSSKQSTSLSIGTIAKPTMVSFQPKVRSTILQRSTSLVSLPSLSRREDEPLAPSPDIEETPSPSVLDALQEISRKRINNEELDAERIKKQCKEITEVDSPAKAYSIILKRSRPSPSNDSEKKRHCSTNEIFSSLSSTQMLPSIKRPATEYLKTSPVAKIHHIDSEKEFKQQQNRPIVIKETAVELAKAATSEAIAVHKAAQPITLFNRTYNGLHAPAREVYGETESEITYVKPSAEVNASKDFVRKTETNKLKILLQCLGGDIYEEDEVDSTKPNSQVPTSASNVTVTTSLSPTTSSIVLSSPAPAPISIMPSSQLTMPKPIAVTTTTFSAPTVITSPQTQKSLTTVSPTLSSFVSAPITKETTAAASVAVPFTFGVKTTEAISATNPVQFTPVNPVPVSTTSKPFSFSTSKPLSDHLSPSGQSSVIGVQQKATESVTTTTATSTTGGFQFGTQSNSTSKVTFGTTIAPLTFGTAATVAPAVTPSKPIFGTQIPSATSAATTQTIGFQSSTNKLSFATTIPLTAPPPTATFPVTTTSDSGFGSTQTNVSEPSKNPFGASVLTSTPQPSTEKLFTISSTSTTTNASAPSIFGVITSDKTSNAFGSGGNSNFGQSAPVFGQSSSENKSVIFGVSGKSSFPTTTASTKLSFGSSTETKAVFGQTTESKSPFGQPLTTETKSPFAQTGETKSVFGQSTPVFGTSSGFGEPKNGIFGTQTEAQNNIIQSSSPFTNQPSSVFGGNMNSGSTSHGASLKPFGSTSLETSTTPLGSFGGSTATSFSNTPQAPAAQSPGGFNFKLSAPQPSANEDKSIFSRLGAKIESPAPNNSKELFSFSGPGNSAFAATSSSAPLTFANNNTFNSTQPPTFGSTVGSSKSNTSSFNFNTASPPSTGSAADTPFVFGNAQPTPSFNFNSGSNSNNNAATPSPAPFAFGGLNSNPSPFNFAGSNPAASFSIGTGSTTAAQRRNLRNPTQRKR